MIYEIKNGRIKAGIDTHGAELKFCELDGVNYVYDGDKKWWDDTAPMLFPICGRLPEKKYSYGGRVYDMNIHGFAPSSDFKVVSASEDKLVLSLSASEETLKAYPFEFVYTAEFSVKEDTLFLDIKVENTGKDTLPYMIGWHPGFILPEENGAKIDDFYLYFENKNELTEELLYPGEPFASGKFEKVELENSRLYIRENYLYPRDTALLFGHGNSCVLKNDKNGFKVSFSWSENLQLLAVWKRDNSSARYLCLEPWSGTPNDGRTDENFETRVMERLYPNTKASYTYLTKIDF